MAEEKPQNSNDSFVENMLRMSKEKKEVKPQSITDNVSKSEIETIMQQIRDKIQKKPK